MEIETSPRITQNGDKNSLGPMSKHPFALKRGINATGREKWALFPKRVACSCLLPLPKNLSVTAACTIFDCWRRRETKGKTKVVEAMEGEGVQTPSP
jgi:hypothetical protein